MRPGRFTSIYHKLTWILLFDGATEHGRAIKSGSLTDRLSRFREYDRQASYPHNLSQIVLNEVDHPGWHFVDCQRRLDERTMTSRFNPIRHQIPSCKGGQ